MIHKHWIRIRTNLGFRLMFFGIKLVDNFRLEDFLKLLITEAKKRVEPVEKKHLNKN